MYNFLDSKLTPTIKTSCPATDDYEASNLISDNLNEKSRGFLAFSAIRPPIELEFKLICPINLHYISIGSEVLTQRSTGFEIYGKVDKDDYKLIGKIFPEESGFVIFNRKYAKKLQKPSIPEHFTSCYFRTNEPWILSNLDQIKVKIIKTANTVPCIKRIEIWGEVSKKCTEKTKETISYLMKPNRLKSNEIYMANELINEPSSSKTLINQLNFPNEFFDEISCEIMSLPMTLPCGKTVDQSTLEKHAANESKWGRVPSDPYTGLPFTDKSKPVLNTALKNRIDQFLFENKDKMETKSIQRTVGRRNDGVKLQLPDYADITHTNTKRIKLDSENVQRSSPTDCLESAIEEVFSKYNVIRFTRMDSIPNVEKSICAFCDLGEKTNLYEIVNCRHLICRLCLLGSPNEHICKKCLKSFKKTDVQKWHCS